MSWRERCTAAEAVGFLSCFACMSIAIMATSIQKEQVDLLSADVAGSLQTLRDFICGGADDGVQ